MARRANFEHEPGLARAGIRHRMEASAAHTCAVAGSEHSIGAAGPEPNRAGQHFELLVLAQVDMAGDEATGFEADLGSQRRPSVSAEVSSTNPSSGHDVWVGVVVAGLVVVGLLVVMTLGYRVFMNQFSPVVDGRRRARDDNYFFNECQSGLMSRYRWINRHVPSSPRCKFCLAPFGGLVSASPSG